jgi:redox-sensitive bicupin YhaK (pirin superfamily)
MSQATAFKAGRTVGGMSNLDLKPQESVCGAQADDGPAIEVMEAVKVWLGKTTQVRRLLPHKRRRMVGAWCFVDHYGPDDLHMQQGMRVPPHPHTSLQTVSWLLDGMVLHRDSLGTEALVRPGELNLMTSGRGIAHSEESVASGGQILHGVQLWVALPHPVRDIISPSFEQYSRLPRVDGEGYDATVIIGSLGEEASPATVQTPLSSVDVAVSSNAEARLPLRPDFEYAVLVLTGAVDVERQLLGVGQMVYLGSTRRELVLRTVTEARVLLLGGEPFDEKIVMWWNLIGRSHEEIVQARADWEVESERFGEVKGFDGPRLPAPPMPNTRLKTRGRTA